MKSILPAALVMLSFGLSPALAQTAAPDAPMAKDDHMMASGDAMKPAMPPMMAMSKADTAKLARCKKMSPARAKKNAGCVKMMAMHPDGHM
jgi:hypothetical protein